MSLQALADEALTVSVPVEHLPYGIIRIAGTRIPLERVIHEFNQGETPERIVRNFDTLNVADVYAIISFYLKHREAVDAYVERRREQEDQTQREVEARFRKDGRRKRLLARQNARVE